MALKSVVEIDLQDSKFQRFVAQYEKVQQQIGKLPGAWKAIGKEQGNAAQQLERGGKAVATQNTLVRTQLEEDKKRLGNLTLQEKLWQSMGKSSTTFFSNVTGASKFLLKWGGLLGAGLLGGGLFGLDRMAQRTGDARSTAMGLGLSIGSQRAFNLGFGRYFGGDASGFLSSVADAAGDVSKIGAFTTLGVNPDPDDIEKTAITTLKALRQLAKSTDPRLFGTTVQSRHLGDLGVNSEIFRALHDSKDAEFTQQFGKFASNRTALNIPDDTAQRLQNFGNQLTTAGLKIERTFIIGLDKAKIPEALSKLSDGFNKFLATLLESDSVKDAFTNLSTWLNNFSGQLGSADFRNNVTSFMSDVGDLASKLHTVLHPIDALRNSRQSTLGFEDHLKDLDKKYGLPAGTLTSVFKTESGEKMYGVPVSSAGAVGPMQLMPGTAAQYGADPTSPYQASDAAGHYLSDLERKYRGDMVKALAAYNWGPGNLDKYLAQNPFPNPGWIHGLPKETRSYVENAVTIKFLDTPGGAVPVVVSQLAGLLGPG